MALDRFFKSCFCCVHFLIAFNRSDNKITKLGPLSLNLLVSKVLLSKVKLCSTDLNDNPLSLRALTWINGSDLRIGPSSLLAGLARVMGDWRGLTRSPAINCGRQEIREHRLTLPTQIPWSATGFKIGPTL